MTVIHELLPGDIVDLPPTLGHATFLTRCPHPKYPGLDQVVWRLPDGTLSFDALHPDQYVGEARQVEGNARIAILREALDGNARCALLEQVAHAAWHALDDGGEVAGEPQSVEVSKRDADRLSAALDDLEASGWTAHDDDPPLGGAS